MAKFKRLIVASNSKDEVQVEGLCTAYQRSKLHSHFEKMFVNSNKMEHTIPFLVIIQCCIMKNRLAFFPSYRKKAFESSELPPNRFLLFLMCL